MPDPRPTISIISFSPIARDARVLRQIDYLAPHYDLVVLGYGAPPPRWQNVESVRWVSADPLRWYEMQHLRALLVAGRVWQPSTCYELWYWLQRPYRQAFERLRHAHANLVFANDWSALPLGWRLAARWNAPLILDLHEYAPLEWEEQWNWRLFAAPMTVYFLRQYAVHADATLTVAPEIAQRYSEEFGFLPTVVLNAPKYVNVEDHAVDQQTVRLIHHGGALRARALESMIDTLRLCDQRYHLSFMLVGDEEYIRYLRAYADRVAPGRVEFLDPVAPDQVVSRIASFDLGIHLLQPTNYNNSIALPNKLFDFIHAGLAICVGPSPGMSAFVREWQCGVVAPSFDPAEVAATLNRLSAEEIQIMRRASRAAAARVNADTEMSKVVELCSRLLRRAQAAG
jgi:glycosyltransferase involved in cell wall biosynthesis